MKEKIEDTVMTIMMFTSLVFMPMGYIAYLVLASTCTCLGNKIATVLFCAFVIIAMLALLVSELRNIWKKKQQD